MIGSVVRKIVGSKNDREIKRLQPLVARINALEGELSALADEDLRAKTVPVPAAPGSGRDP